MVTSLFSSISWLINSVKKVLFSYSLYDCIGISGVFVFIMCFDSIHVTSLLHKHAVDFIGLAHQVVDEGHDPGSSVGGGRRMPRLCSQLRVQDFSSSLKTSPTPDSQRNGRVLTIADKVIFLRARA